MRGWSIYKILFFFLFLREMKLISASLKTWLMGDDFSSDGQQRAIPDFIKLLDLSQQKRIVFSLSLSNCHRQHSRDHRSSSKNDNTNLRERNRLGTRVQTIKRDVSIDEKEDRHVRLKTINTRRERRPPVIQSNGLVFLSTDQKILIDEI